MITLFVVGYFVMGGGGGGGVLCKQGDGSPRNRERDCEQAVTKINTSFPDL